MTLLLLLTGCVGGVVTAPIRAAGDVVEGTARGAASAVEGAGSIMDGGDEAH